MSVVAMGWLLVALVGLTQLCVAGYWRAVVHDAAARAATAGAALDGDIDSCDAAFASAFGAKLGAGANGSGLTVRPVQCRVEDGLLIAATGFTMDPWLPLWPAWSAEFAVPAVIEHDPGVEIER